MRNRRNVLIIETPEGVRFPLILAGPFLRAPALIIDFMCIMLLQNIFMQLVRLAGIIDADFANAMALVMIFIITFGYNIAFEWWWNGVTLGKKLFGLRVVDIHGVQLQFSQVFIRNVFRILDMLPFLYLVGGICCMFSGRYQRLGDYVAQTVVIRTPEIFEPELSNIISDKYNSLKDYPHLVTRLRNSVSPEEAEVIFNALIRRNLLTPSARRKLYGELAGLLNEKAPFPREVMDSLSDERYLRNAVELLFEVRHT